MIYKLLTSEVFLVIYWYIAIFVVAIIYYCYLPKPKPKYYDGLDMSWNNCLLKAIIVKLKKPNKIIIYKRGLWIDELLKLKFPHFYWFDEEKKGYYHFQSNKGGLLFFHQLWFKGFIRKFNYHNK